MLPALVLILALLAPASAAAAQKPDSAPGTGRWIVVYEDSVRSVDRETEARERRRGFRSRLRFKRAIEGFSARLTAEQVRGLRADPKVEAVVPDRPVSARAAQPLAPGEPPAPTGVRRIGAGAQTWVREAASTGVAVVDTGIDLDHPDLNVANGTDCIAPGTSAEDENGHGTHVAGTIGARNNGAGVTGVAPGTRVDAVRVLDEDGSGTDSTVICGLDWVLANAAARGIRVLNMSLGGLGENDRNCGTTNDDVLHQAVCRVNAAGVLNVVAAGNDNWNISDSPQDVPATYPEALTVSAMADGDGAPGGQLNPTCSSSTDDARAAFSSFTRNDLDKAHMIAAPGVCITSTWLGGGYETISGTSMATPHVAGAVALCIGEAGVPGPCADMTPGQILQRMRADAEAFRAAQPGSGFTGDPSAPLANGNFYGYLVSPVANGPATAITAAPPDTTSDSTPTHEFGSSTPGAGFECSLDGGAFGSCSSPHTSPELADGPHQLAVRAVDVAGTADASPAVHDFVVDAVPDPPQQQQQQQQQSAVDTLAPAAKLSSSSRQRIGTVSRTGLRVAVTCSEPCRLLSRVVLGSSTARQLSLVRRGSFVAGQRARGLGAGRRIVTIRLTSRVRRQLARARTVLTQVRVTATDAAGNARTVKRAVRLIR